MGHCQLKIPSTTLVTTTGNRGTSFPYLVCPVKPLDPCPLLIQEGENNILYLETGEFLLMPCDY